MRRRVARISCTGMYCVYRNFISSHVYVPALRDEAACRLQLLRPLHEKVPMLCSKAMKLRAIHIRCVRYRETTKHNTTVYYHTYEVAPPLTLDPLTP